MLEMLNKHLYDIATYRFDVFGHCRAHTGRATSKRCSIISAGEKYYSNGQILMTGTPTVLPKVSVNNNKSYLGSILSCINTIVVTKERRGESRRPRTSFLAERPQKFFSGTVANAASIRGERSSSIAVLRKCRRESLELFFFLFVLIAVGVGDSLSDSLSSPPERRK